MAKQPSSASSDKSLSPVEMAPSKARISKSEQKPKNKKEKKEPKAEGSEKKIPAKNEAAKVAKAALEVPASKGSGAKGSKKVGDSSRETPTSEVVGTKFNDPSMVEAKRDTPRSKGQSMEDNALSPKSVKPKQPSKKAELAPPKGRREYGNSNSQCQSAEVDLRHEPLTSDKDEEDESEDKPRENGVIQKQVSGDLARREQRGTSLASLRSLQSYPPSEVKEMSGLLAGNVRPEEVRKHAILRRGYSAPGLTNQPTATSAVDQTPIAHTVAANMTPIANIDSTKHESGHGLPPTKDTWPIYDVGPVSAQHTPKGVLPQRRQSLELRKSCPSFYQGNLPRGNKAKMTEAGPEDAQSSSHVGDEDRRTTHRVAEPEETASVTPVETVSHESEDIFMELDHDHTTLGSEAKELLDIICKLASDPQEWLSVLNPTDYIVENGDRLANDFGHHTAYHTLVYILGKMNDNPEKKYEQTCFEYNSIKLAHKDASKAYRPNKIWRPFAILLTEKHAILSANGAMRAKLCARLWMKMVDRTPFLLDTVDGLRDIEGSNYPPTPSYVVLLLLTLAPKGYLGQYLQSKSATLLVDHETWYENSLPSFLKRLRNEQYPRRSFSHLTVVYHHLVKILHGEQVTHMPTPEYDSDTEVDEQKKAAAKAHVAGRVDGLAEQTAKENTQPAASGGSTKRKSSTSQADRDQRRSKRVRNSNSAHPRSGKCADDG